MEVSIPHFLSGLFQYRVRCLDHDWHALSQSHISYQVYFNFFFKMKAATLSFLSQSHISYQVYFNLAATHQAAAERKIIGLNPTFPIRSISIDHLVIICNPAS